MRIDDPKLRAALRPTPQGWQERDGHRLAAVLAPILFRDGEDHLVFTERRADLQEHPGQIAFPGGARESEEDPAATALRESQEEVGLDPTAVDLLGSLPQRISSSKFLVHALVGRVDAHARLEPDPGEVASIFTVPVRELATSSNWQERAYRRGDGWTLKTPHYQHEQHLIWGLTGRLAKDLADLIAATRRERR